MEILNNLLHINTENGTIYVPISVILELLEKENKLKSL